MTDNTLIGYRNEIFQYALKSTFESTHGDTISTPALSPDTLLNFLEPQLSLAEIISTFTMTNVAEVIFRWTCKDDSDTEVNIPIRIIGVLEASVSGQSMSPSSVATALNLRLESVVIKNVANATVFNSSGWIVQPYIRYDGFANHFWLILPNTVSGSEVTITMRANKTGAAAYQFTFGGLWIGPAFVPELGIEENWSMQVVDLGQMGTSVGLQGYPQEKPKARLFNGTFAVCDRKRAYGVGSDLNGMDFQRLAYQIGTTGFCTLFPITLDVDGETYDPHIVHRLGLYGHFASFSRIRKLAGDNYSPGDFTFQELR